MSDEPTIITMNSPNETVKNAFADIKAAASAMWDGFSNEVGEIKIVAETNDHIDISIPDSAIGTEAVKTVRQFIDELQKMPPDAEIVVLGQGGSEGCECVPIVEMHRSGWLSGKVLVCEDH